MRGSPRYGLSTASTSPPPGPFSAIVSRHDGSVWARTDSTVSARYRGRPEVGTTTSTAGPSGSGRGALAVPASGAEAGSPVSGRDVDVLTGRRPSSSFPQSDPRSPAPHRARHPSRHSIGERRALVSPPPGWSPPRRPATVSAPPPHPTTSVR